jgi:hypothetical protein
MIPKPLCELSHLEALACLEVHEKNADDMTLVLAKLASVLWGMPAKGAPTRHWSDLPAALDAELQENDDLRRRLAELLTGTANALKGKPKPLHSHDWSDLPAVAAKVVNERDVAQGIVLAAMLPPQEIQK